MPQLSYIAVPMLTTPEDFKLSPVKICTALLSLVSLVDPESFDVLGIERLIEVIKRTFDYSKVPSDASNAVRLDLANDIILSRAKALEIDNKKPGVATELARVLDECLKDILPEWDDGRGSERIVKDDPINPVL